MSNFSGIKSLITYESDKTPNTVLDLTTYDSDSSTLSNTTLRQRIDSHYLNSVDGVQSQLLLAAGKTEGVTLNDVFIGYAADSTNTYSYYDFPGSTSYLTVPTNTDLDLQGDFTLECWFNFNATTAMTFFNRATLFGSDIANCSWRFSYNAGVFIYDYNKDGVSTSIQATWTTPTVGAWYHIALVRSGNDGKFFVNGIQVDTTKTISGNPVIVNRTLEIGNTPAQGWQCNGKLRGARISNVARYTGAFSPSMKLVADSYTKLLISPTEQIYDATNVKTVTNTSATFADAPAGHPYAKTAGYFNGSSDYLSISPHTDITFSSDNTLRFWFYPILGATQQQLFCKSDGTNGFYCMINPSNKIVWMVGASVITLTTTNDINLNSWNYVIFKRIGNLYSIILNGIEVYGVSATTPSVHSTCVIGQIIGYGQYYKGYIADLEFASIDRGESTPNIQLVADAYTKLLLPMSDGRDLVAIDNTGKALTSGSTVRKTKTSWLPISNTAAYFDGTGDYLSIADSDDFAIGSNDFTFEFWYNPTSAPSDYGHTIFTQNSGSGNIIICTLYPTVFYFRAWNSTMVLDFNTAFTPTVNQWHYVKISRLSGQVKVLINGVQIGSTLSNAVSLNNISGFFTIGADTVTANAPLKGFLSDFRFRNGVGDHSTAVPTTQLTADMYTKLLLHMDNPEPKAAVDSSGTNKVITSGSTVTTSIVSIHPYQNVAAYFDGSGDYLTSPDYNDFDFGTGDFTIRGWYNFSSTGIQVLASKWVATGNQRSWELAYQSNLLYFFMTADGSNTVTVTSNAFTPVIGTWYFIQVSRTGGNITFYINGVPYGSAANTTNIYNSTAIVQIGCDNSAGYPFNGHMADIEIANVARANVVPTAPLTADAYTKLLVHMDNIQPKAATDSSGTNKVITTGSTATSSAVSVHPYQNVAAYFDGTGDYLSSATSTDFNLQNDFTIEGWYNFSSISRTVFIDRSTNFSTDIGNSSWRFEFINPNVLEYQWNSSGASTWVSVTWAPNIGTWYHIALVRSGNEAKFFVNGLQVGATQSVTTSPVIKNRQIEIGGNSSIPLLASSGYMADWRISNTARYASNFSVPAAQLSSDANTKLLLPMSTYGTTFTDTTGKTVTRYGDTKQVVVNHGDKALSFDGTLNSQVKASSSIDFAIGTEAFTIEGWAYFNAAFSTNHAIFSTGDFGGTGITIGTSNTVSNCIRISAMGNWVSPDAAGNVPIGQWVHIAVTRDGTNTIRLFINGVISYSGTYATSISSQSGFYVGSCDGNYPMPSNSRIAWAAMHKGVARYTADFTPPVAPVIDSNTKIYVVPQYNNKNFIDVVGKTIDRYGDTKQVIVNHGDKVLDFDGTSTGNIVTTDTQGLDFGTGDFCVESWVNFTDFSTHRVILDDNNSMLRLYQYSNSLYGLNNISVAINNYPVNTWHHICYTRSSGVLRFFVDGKQIGSDIANTTNVILPTTLYIGRANSALYHQGKIAWAALHKGIARYTTDFIPPVTPVIDSYTKLYIVPQNSNKTFIDSIGKPVTRYGDTKQVVCQPDKNIKSIAFDGTSNSQSIVPYSTDFDFNGDAFTVEGWMYVTTQTAYGGLMQCWSTTGWNLNSNASSLLRFYSSTANLNLVSSVVTPTNRWFHIAATRDASGNCVLWLDGISIATAVNVNSITATSNPLQIGYLNSGFINKVAWAAIHKGVARYTTDFIPPAAPVVDSYTKLYVVPGTDQKAFIDEGTYNPKTITRNGNAIQSYLGYNRKALAFTATSNNLSYPGSDDFNFGNTPSTIDFWFRDTGGGDQILNQGYYNASYNGNWALGYHSAFSNGLGIYSYDGQGNVEGINLNYATRMDSVWRHFAIVLNGKNLKFFVNGVLLKDHTMNKTLGNLAPFVINGSGWSTAMIGNMSNFRISKGIARWTSNFDPTAIDYTVDQYTKLLCKPSLTDATNTKAYAPSTTLEMYKNFNSNSWDFDVSSQESITNPLIVGSGYKFNGTSDYISIPQSTDFDLGPNDFTIEAYIEATSLSNSPAIVSKWVGANGYRSFIVSLAPSVFAFSYSTTGNDILSVSVPYTFILNKEYHICVMRKSNKLYFFVNGQQVGQTFGFSDTIYTAVTPLEISSYVTGSRVQYFSGIIRDLTISKGIARY